MRTTIEITKDHTGKMKGMGSVSTSCKVNANCAKYAQIPGSICSKCYAQRMTKMYKNLDAKLRRNFDVLTTDIIPIEELPTLNYGYFRIEAFGDLANVTQAINYLNLIQKNPQTFFGWWTKNPKYIAEALETMKIKKPKNVNIIYSSMFINKRMEVEYPFIDKVFTVYDKDYIKENKIKINCGGRSCLSCHRCYEKNRTKYINEQVK